MASSNVAYDLSRYSPEVLPGTPQVRQSVRQPPELRVIETRTCQSRAFLTRFSVLFIISLCIVASILYNNVVLTELTAEIETLETQQEALRSAHRQMQVDLEARLSLRSIEEAALTRLGMSKVEPYQVEYIDIGQTAGVRMVREPRTDTQDWLRAVLQPVLEYLGL